MAIYDTEEEQVEAVKRWWKENSQAVIIGVVVGVGLIFGINLWKSHQQEQRLNASQVYEQLMAEDKQGKATEVEKLAQNIGLQYGSTPYASFAALFQAKAKVQQGDLAAAKGILEKLISTGNDNVKNIAKLRLLRIMLALGEYEQGLKLIAETDAASSEGFSSSFEELKGDLYVALNRNEEARTAYETAQREGAPSPLLQFKLEDLATAAVKPPAMANSTPPVDTPAGASTETPVIDQK